jgi:hypothetical protein
VSGQLHALDILPQGKSPRYPLDRRLVGPQSCSRHGGEEKNSQSPLRIAQLLSCIMCPYKLELDGLLIRKFFINFSSTCVHVVLSPQNLSYPI